MNCLAEAVGSPWTAKARGLRTALLVAVAAALAWGAAQPPDAGRTDVVLVLDASGSMFNELPDGRLRITAAKEALAAFVGRLPGSAGLNVGLRVYGARTMALDPDACLDSELVVPVAGLERELLLRTVQGTEPRGATPIAYSLERAAEDLQAATGRKQIVLVTDGEESCGGDLRAVAERLAGEGFEIDLHVIGLALTPEAERSFQGIGTFQSVSSAAELAEALGRAVELPAAPETLRVTVRLTRDGQPAADGASVTFVAALGAGQHALRQSGPGEFEGDLPAGGYTALVSDAFGAPSTFAGLTVAADAENDFAFELAPAFEVDLAVAPLDPVKGGELEARYHLLLPEGGTRVVGRSAAFTARAVEATLDAPAEVAGGVEFEVAFDGPDNMGDMVVVAPVGADAATFLAYTFTSFGAPARLVAPVDVGEYEVRYVGAAGGGVLASRPLSVVASEVSVTAPAEVMGGSQVSIDWQGPNGPQDMIVFAPQGSPQDTFLTYTFTQFGVPSMLDAPVDPGPYEVRYLSGAERRPLASAVVNVTAPVVSLDAPAEVGAGAAFAVGWTGPDGSGDYVTIVPVGAADTDYLSVAFTAWGSSLDLTAPDAPGSYEVRYFSGSARKVLASVPVVVR